MDEVGLLTFGTLLRRTRQAAGLTQAELAERAGVSVRTVSDLERDVSHAPHRDTVRLLADALALSQDERPRFELAARRWRAGPAQAPSVAASAYPLPRPLTPLIGREREVAAVCQRLLDPHTRLLTLTGAGGTGKTRLALHVADAVREAFVDGVCFVDLAPLADPDLVLPTIAHTLGLPEAGHRSPRDALLSFLRDKRLLLLLDNCEHLLDATPDVSSLLAASSQLRVLATSRAALRVRGEREYPVPPLALPPTPLPPLEVLAQSEAVRLFVARAQDVQPSFALSAESAPAVAEICVRLDGLPLALELAAARIRVLSPPALLARLERRLPLLVGGARDLPERQRTLRATLAWSHDLLDEADQGLFARLSVFVGGWTLAAAEAVCGGREIDVLGGLVALVEQSLVQAAEGADGEHRYGMLETIREYATERLEASGEVEEVRRRHTDYCVALAEAAEPELAGPKQVMWLDLLETEHDNLRAALRWAHACSESEIALRLAVALIWFWAIRGHYSEGNEWLEAPLSAAARENRADLATLQARACYGRGLLAFERGDDAHALALAEQSLALFHQRGDIAGVCDTLWLLGEIAQSQRDLARAATLFQACLTQAQEQNDTARSANAFVNLGQVAHERGDYEQAIALIAEGLALFQRLGDLKNIAFAHVALGRVARDRGDYERAAMLSRKGLALFQDMDDKRQVASTLAFLGEMAHEQGDRGQAGTLHRASLRLYHELGAQARIAAGLEALAAILHESGQPDRAAQLSGAAAALRVAISAPLAPTDRAAYERSVAAMHATLGESAFAAAWAAGQALSQKQAITEALAESH